MKNQSIIVMLSFTALALTWSPSANASEDNEFQRAAKYNCSNLHIYQENEDFKAKWESLDTADEEAARKINALLAQEAQFQEQLHSALQQSRLDPLPHYGIPVVQSYDEDDPEIQEILAASLISAREDDMLRESQKRTERKQQKKSLIRDIVELHPQVIVLREDKKELEVQQSDAWNKYYPLKDLIDSKEKEEKEKLWNNVLQEGWKVSSKLNDATSGLNSIIEQYLALISDQDLLKEVDKNPKSERGQEKKRLEQELRDVRSEIARLREELQKKEGEVSEKRERYLLNREVSWETLDKLGKEVSSIQLELDSVIAQESERIAAYFMFVHKLGVPSVNSSDKL